MDGLSVACGAAVLGGLVFWRAAWGWHRAAHHKAARRRVAAFGGAGVGCLLLAGAIAHRLVAWDRAVTVVLLGLGGLAVPLLMAGGRYRSRRRRADARARAVPRPVAGGAGPWRGAADIALRLVAAGPLSAALGGGMAVLVVAGLGGDLADRLILAGFLAPLTWALAAVWALSRLRAWSGALGVALAGLALAVPLGCLLGWFGPLSAGGAV